MNLKWLPIRFSILAFVYLLAIQPSFATSDKEPLWELLNSSNENGEAIVDFLSREAEIKALFDSSSGVWEGYSVRTHTLMVFKVFSEQFELYQSKFKFKFPPDVRLRPTFKMALAVHDIGKPQAIAAGDKKRQHEFTIPILEKAFSQFGFSQNEIKLAKALVGNDVLGDFVRGIIDSDIAYSQLDSIALISGLPLVDFLPLQFLFYTSDAASYPTLREGVFTPLSNGALVPKNMKFQTLVNRAQGACK